MTLEYSSIPQLTESLSIYYYSAFLFGFLVYESIIPFLWAFPQSFLFLILTCEVCMSELCDTDPTLASQILSARFWGLLLISKKWVTATITYKPGSFGVIVSAHVYWGGKGKPNLQREKREQPKSRWLRASSYVPSSRFPSFPQPGPYSCTSASKGHSSLLDYSFQ